MDFPIVDLLDDELATGGLVKHFHPEGLKCSHCQASDGIREVHTNTTEGLWTTVRNISRPFRGVHKKYLSGYLAICEFGINEKRITSQLISKWVCIRNK